MLRSKPETLVEDTPLTNGIIFDADFPAGMTDAWEADLQVAKDLANAEIDEEIKKSVGSANFEDFQKAFVDVQESLDGVAKYRGAERYLSHKIRRSRLAMLGFSALSVFSLGKSAQHLINNDFTIFAPTVPISLESRSVQDCYTDPTRTQLNMDEIWRDPQPGDDDSVSHCLTKMADTMEKDLAASRDKVSVKPYVNDTETLIENMRSQAENPGEAAPQALIDEQADNQATIGAEDDHFGNEGSAILWYALLGICTAGSTAGIFETQRLRKRSLRLLSELQTYRYEDVVIALDTDVNNRYKVSEAPAHKMTITGTQDVRMVALLPKPDPSIDKRHDNRWDTLQKLQAALNQNDAPS